MIGRKITVWIYVAYTKFGFWYVFCMNIMIAYTCTIAYVLIIQMCTYVVSLILFTVYAFEIWVAYVCH